MNKTDLIDAISDRADIPKSVAARTLEATLEAVIDSLAHGDDVRLTGFGTFSVTDRAARAGRNPQTGETIQIPASRVPGFKAGKEFKQAVK